MGIRVVLEVVKKHFTSEVYTLTPEQIKAKGWEGLDPQQIADRVLADPQRNKMRPSIHSHATLTEEERVNRAETTYTP